MKLKKLVYCAGFSGILFTSLLTLDKYNFKKRVDEHYEKEYIHNGNIIAHRGFSSREVENSFNSVVCAVNCDCADGVEIDVRLTKDNELVLAHNSYIPGIGKISKKNLNDIKKEKYKTEDIPKVKLAESYIINIDGKLLLDRYNDTIEKSEEITTLKEVLSINSKKNLLVDMKFSKNGNIKFMDKVDDIFSKYNSDFEIILQANNYEELLKMKKRYPNYKYQLIIRKEKELKYLNSEFEMFGIRKNLVTKSMVQEAQKDKKIISVWTINTCYEYEELKTELGENINDIFIITDYPDEICYLNNKKEKTKVLK